ncbi:MAG: acyltransferase family protein [Pseudomonadota bacterium]
MNTSEPERFHALDVLRASALLLGIVLHSAMSYLPGFREVNWPLADESTSAGLGILFFVIHMFRMSLFFIIAGFFARVLHQRLGTAGLLKNRLRRIGLPLLAFYLLVMPLTIVAFIWGARQLGIHGPPKMPAPIPVVGPPVPWGHLWFLYLLLVIYGLLLLGRAIVVRLDANGALRAAIGRLLAIAVKARVAPLLLAAPIAATLFVSPWWHQWMGLPAPILGFVPNFPALLAYGGAFLVGWFFHRQQECLRVLAADWPLYLAVALLGTTAALYIVGTTPVFGPLSLGVVERVAYTGAYTIALWCWSFAAIGLVVRYFNAPNASWRYLADASYWMYLIHLPIVCLLQARMLGWPLHWSVKLPLILLLTGATLVLSYRYLVRDTFMGTFLNGRRHSRSVRERAVAKNIAQA